MIAALIGNQNCGKTTLFNQLTGANQHVGNFPGVTVEGKQGQVRNVKDVTVVDLPGIYSLRTYSAEEIVTREFLFGGHPDAVINIIDATNIERNLYLTLQLLEFGLPTVIALNMMDEVTGNGGSVDIEKLSQELGVPVVPVSAAKKQGINELVRVLCETAKNKLKPHRVDFCEGGAVHRCIHAVSHQIEDHAASISIAPRFASTKVIEGDEEIIEKLNLDVNEKELIEHSIVEMESEVGLDRNAAIADMRYTFIERVCSECVTKPKESKEHARSIKIDKILTNKYASIPIFVGVMFLIFYLTFEVIGAYLSDWLGMGIDALSDLVGKGLDKWGVNEVVRSLVIDGIFTGVGSVLSFLPLIVTLFFFLSILEDSGYMARVAFVMDKLLRKIGLSGKSIVPMLLGFGCSVPAIMATRTLSSARDRKMTVLLTPFMSCSAKIPIYAVFTAAFFTKYRALIMIGLYLMGIAIGIVAALIFKNTAFKGDSAPFVMELPSYRFPSPKSVLLLLWEKAKDFVVRAFTVIFVATLIIWFLQTFDVRFNPVYISGEDSLLAEIGKIIAPIFAPLGFGDWRISTSLIAGFTAKEAVVSTLAVLMGTDMANLSGALGSVFTPLTAFTFLTFTLLYTPCVAAIAAIKRELGSGWKALGVAVAQCLIAWIVAFFVYRLGALFTSAYGFGTADAVVIAIVAAAVVAAVVYIVLQKRKGKCIGCSGACVSCSECPAVHKCTRSATEKYERTLEYALVKKEKPCYNIEKQPVTSETTDAETTGGEHNSEPQ